MADLLKPCCNVSMWRRVTVTQFHILSIIVLSSVVTPSVSDSLLQILLYPQVGFCLIEYL